MGWRALARNKFAKLSLRSPRRFGILEQALNLRNPGFETYEHKLQMRNDFKNPIEIADALVRNMYLAKHETRNDGVF